MFALGTPVLCTLAMLAQSGWSVSAGRESFSYRDVPRAGPPADASPIEWTGVGPSLFVNYERANEKRAHRFTFDAASAGSFVYDGPVTRVDAPSSDSARRIEGRYEYRRYFFRDKFVRGLDIPLGVQGLSRHLSLERQLTVTQSFTSNSAGFGGSIGARFHRWQRWSAEIAWVNGMALIWEHDSYSVDPASAIDLHGGGWLTDLSASGQVRLAQHAWVTVAWLTTGESNYVSHHDYVFARQRLTAGVTYGR
jgi:hypothetical protein